MSRCQAYCSSSNLPVYILNVHSHNFTGIIIAPSTMQVNKKTADFTHKIVCVGVHLHIIWRDAGEFPEGRRRDTGEVSGWARKLSRTSGIFWNSTGHDRRGVVVEPDSNAHLFLLHIIKFTYKSRIEGYFELNCLEFDFIITFCAKLCTAGVQRGYNRNEMHTDVS